MNSLMSSLRTLGLDEHLDELLEAPRWALWWAPWSVLLQFSSSFISWLGQSLSAVNCSLISPLYTLNWLTICWYWTYFSGGEPDGDGGRTLEKGKRIHTHTHTDNCYCTSLQKFFWIACSIFSHEEMPASSFL